MIQKRFSFSEVERLQHWEFFLPYKEWPTCSSANLTATLRSHGGSTMLLANIYKVLITSLNQVSWASANSSASLHLSEVQTTVRHVSCRTQKLWEAKCTSEIVLMMSFDMCENKLIIHSETQVGVSASIIIFSVHVRNDDDVTGLRQLSLHSPYHSLTTRCMSRIDITAHLGASHGSICNLTECDVEISWSL